MARTTQAVWEERLARWRKSGRSLEDFAAHEGVKLASMKWWRWKLGGERSPAAKADQKPVAFIEVAPAATPAPVASSYEVVLGNGRVVRVTGGFTDETLARVVVIAERAR